MFRILREINVEEWGFCHFLRIRNLISMIICTFCKAEFYQIFIFKASILLDRNGSFRASKIVKITVFEALNAIRLISRKILENWSITLPIRFYVKSILERFCVYHFDFSSFQLLKITFICFSIVTLTEVVTTKSIPNGENRVFLTNVKLSGNSLYENVA